MQTQDRPHTITLNEQEEKYGIKRANFVAVTPKRERAPLPMPINAQVSHTIDATPQATQHVEVRTNAVDRALGFMIATLPLCVAFGVVVLGVVVLGFGVPLLSLPSLIVLFIVFATVWSLAYLHTLSISAEGVSMFEAQSKWDVIKQEQRYRWAHYASLLRGSDE